MFNLAKNTDNTEKSVDQIERRKNGDRRVSDDETRFPFIDDNCNLIMKDRRVSNRRESDIHPLKKPLSVVKGLLKK